MARRIAFFYDPEAERNDVPTYPWGLAPAGLATRAQLVAKGLRPRGKHVAQVMWDSSRSPQPRVAFLYEIATATPPTPLTPAKAKALEAAMRARRTCPECGDVGPYCLSTSLGTCLPCSDGFVPAA
ncbi:RRQRL motif-containing zinc-binding protein [Streptomyces sp. NBC_01506]|uniref:RRQRL motif-containing zinc-binding protein n=1 Tax=Streptomyces sp. NBC_01506 TaxID=2903887 RepID=UPI002F918196